MIRRPRLVIEGFAGARSRVADSDGWPSPSAGADERYEFLVKFGSEVVSDILEEIASSLEVILRELPHSWPDPGAVAITYLRSTAEEIWDKT